MSLGSFVTQKRLTPEQLELLFAFLAKMTRIDVSLFQSAALDTRNSETLKKDCINFILEQYDLFRKNKDEERMSMAEKWLMLETVDQAWKQHMLNLDHLKRRYWSSWMGTKKPAY